MQTAAATAKLALISVYYKCNILYVCMYKEYWQSLDENLNPVTGNHVTSNH